MQNSIYLILFISILFSGCASTYPMNFSEEEWSKLSLKEQKNYRVMQYNLDEKRRLEYAKKETLEKQLQLEKQRFEQKRLKLLYKKGKVKDIVIINLYNGHYIDHKKTKQLIPKSITLVRGETRKVDVQLRDSNNYRTTKSLWFSFDQTGNELKISDTEYSHNNSQIVILNNGKWFREKRYKRSIKFNNRQLLKKMVIGVRYKRPNNHKNRTIIYR